MGIKAYLLFLFIVPAGGVASLAQDAAPLVAAGARVAAVHCARCHVVDEVNVFGGISSTPSFPLLVKALVDWEDRFQSFHTRPPHPAVIRFEGEVSAPDKPVSIVPVELNYSDIEAIVAYARSLKKTEQ